MFKRTRYAPAEHHADLDEHVLRWMLSDGAGACLLSRAPRADGISLQLSMRPSLGASRD